MHTHELRSELRGPISPLHPCESIVACMDTREWEHLYQAWRRGRALLSKMHSLHHHRASARATVLMTAVLVRRFQTCRTLVRRVARRGGSHTRFQAATRTLPCAPGSWYGSPHLRDRATTSLPASPPAIAAIHAPIRSIDRTVPLPCLPIGARAVEDIRPLRSSFEFPPFPVAGGGCTSHGFVTRSNGRVAHASRRALDGACSVARRFGDGEVRRWITWQSRKCRSWCGGVRPPREQGAREGSWRGRQTKQTELRDV